MRVDGEDSGLLHWPCFLIGEVQRQVELLPRERDVALLEGAQDMIERSRPVEVGVVPAGSSSEQWQQRARLPRPAGFELGADEARQCIVHIRRATDALSELETLPACLLRLLEVAAIFVRLREHSEHAQVVQVRG